MRFGCNRCLFGQTQRSTKKPTLSRLSKAHWRSEVRSNTPEHASAVVSAGMFFKTDKLHWLVAGWDGVGENEPGDEKMPESRADGVVTLSFFVLPVEQ